MSLFVSLIDQNAFNLQSMISALVGTVVGAFASLIVNATLIEISLSTFFAVVNSIILIISKYYGILFMLIGGFILYRTKEKQNNVESQQDFAGRKPLINAFGYLIIASGFFSIILDKNWFGSFSPLLKTPLYMVLGSSISFALVFATVDFINFLGGYFRRMEFRSLIDTPHQIITLTSISLMMGAIYGLIFGWMDIEDSDASLLNIRMMKEEKYCLVIGGLLGAFGGLINELLSRNITQNLFQRIPKDPFGEEI